MTSIGIMQGRLSPPVRGRIQAFPGDGWEEEFRKAAALGFGEIEFIFEAPDWEKNPLSNEEGLERIRKISAETGVKVNYVCADYFMEKPFFRVFEMERERSIKMLKRLIRQCSKIGIKGIEIPLVDNSRIETREEAVLFAKSLRECLPVAEAGNIRLLLETSLNPDDFRALIEKIGHPLVRANYDTGNSASLGYNPMEEIWKLATWIDNVHIKDRKLGGGTVPLGEGNADFDAVFQTLRKVAYRGSFILQAARGGDEVKVARKYLAFVRRYVQTYLS
ncbi:MAG TPA: sugar phosphate isomerase/epimerase [Dehalococcoidales bacterium]